MVYNLEIIMRNTIKLKKAFLVCCMLLGMIIFFSCNQDSVNSTWDESKKPKLTAEQERIRNSKAKFMANNLPLDAADKEGFKKVYFDYLDSKLVASEKYGYDKDVNDYVNELSEEEFLAIFKKTKELQFEIAKIERNFVDKFSKIMPPKKVAKFFQIEKKRRDRISIDRKDENKNAPNLNQRIGQSRPQKDRLQKRLNSNRGVQNKEN